MSAMQDRITATLTGRTFAKRELHPEQVAPIAKAVADALKPRTITDRADFQHLPIRAIVQGADGFRHENRLGGWLLISTTKNQLHDASAIALPATVLHIPGEHQ